MRKNWYQVKAVADKPTVISIYDEIGMWGVTAKDFIASLRTIDSAEITLELNTPGGSVFDGLAIFNALKQCGKTVNVSIMGIAASMGSYLAMVGSKISMAENTFMMVHNPLNAIYGNAAEMREMADVLDKIGSTLVSTYVTRSGQTLEAMTALLDAETYLTAAECLALGLCDEVTPAVTATACFEREQFPANVQALFKPVAVVVPEPFANQVSAIATAAGMADYAPAWAVACADVAALTVRMAEAIEITALCAVVKQPTKASEFINAGVTLVAARTALSEALAATDTLVDTIPLISKDPLSGVQPTGLKSADVLAARRQPQGVKK